MARARTHRWSAHTSTALGGCNCTSEAWVASASSASVEALCAPSGLAGLELAWKGLPDGNSTISHPPVLVAHVDLSAELNLEPCYFCRAKGPVGRAHRRILDRFLGLPEW